MTADHAPAAGGAEPRVVAVVVAYNRAELLAACLDALQAQTYPLAATVVVDNASTDATGSVASEHPLGVDLVRLDRNTGGAGGFAAGMARALARHDADLVWLLDDDTVPTPSALAELVSARAAYPGEVAFLGSRVVWTDGRDHPMNTPRTRPGASEQDLAAARSVGAVPVRSSSFVSMLVNVADVRRLGLPMADYFIWNDDFEYSCRLARDGVGLYVPASVVEHRTKTFGTTDADPGDRFFYEVRNKLWLFGRAKVFRPVEGVGYAGSSLRRWGRTVWRSSDRGRLLRAGGRGLRAGLAGPPRPTEQVLAGFGEVSEDVVTVQRGVGTSPGSRRG